MRRLGIDPGIGGALVVLEDGQPVEWMHMPVYLVGKSKRVNGYELADWIRSVDVDVAFMEQVGAMPGQGVTSMFSFGHSAGTVTGIIATLGISLCLITPQEWKKQHLITGMGKDASRAKAIHMWPQWKELHKKGKGQAFADAALIAMTGRQA
jgi:crossover junction endodeoxyribonuclease RuvC